MKKILALLILGFGTSNATERVNLGCFFNAIAEGYFDKVYCINLVRADENLYNSDGSSGNNGKVIFADSIHMDHLFAFGIFDGKTYQLLSTYDEVRYNIPVHWSTSTGEITCTLNKDWREEYIADLEHIIDIISPKER